MAQQFTVNSVTPEEVGDALRLVLQYVIDPQERERRWTNAMRLIARGELAREGLFVAKGSGKLLGALACTPVAGASGVLWPPQTVAGPHDLAIEDQLVQKALAWLQQKGAKLVQGLLAADELAFGAGLVRNGFQAITRLWYMRHHLDLPVHQWLAEDRLTYKSYRQADSNLFHETLLKTYENTADCPEVNGVRTIDEIMAGHKAQGKHDPGRWWLAFQQAEPVGVLLLVENPEISAWEVAYLGVVAGARHRGIGRELTRKALCEARLAGVGQLTLSVDARNRIAWKMYRKSGFEPFEERSVFLAISR